MDELKHLTHPTSLLPLANALQKIVQSIKRQKLDEHVQENAIKEIEWLKDQCASDNMQLSLLSCQSLYCLVEDGVLQPANVLTMFMSLLSNASNAEQYTVLSEGIINLLLLDMRQRSIQKKTERYSCPFGLRSPQHPMIMLLQKKNSNITDLANKMNGICTHRNKFIRANSLEFLRPVFTFVLCNPSGVPESKSIWNLFLTNAGKSSKTMQLFYDTMGWIRIASPASCLQLSILLAETIDHLLNQKQYAAVANFQIYLVALLLTINDHCYDPRPLLSCILRSLEDCPDKSVWSRHYFNYLLIILAQLLHVIPPFYFSDALRVIKYLIDGENQGNAIVRQMILDGLIVRLAGAVKTLPNDAIGDARKLVNALKQKTLAQRSDNESVELSDCGVTYFHPKIAMNFNLAVLSEDLCNGRIPVTTFIGNVSSNELLCAELHYFLRGLLLVDDDHFVSANDWNLLWKCLFKLVKKSSELSTDMMYFVLYHIAKEVDGKKQLELLRALTNFAAVKENMPIILNTYRALSTSSTPSLKTLSLDLYTRLWIAESRTYQFLYKVLTGAPETSLAVKDEWEMNIARAHSIKQICSLKASQHGTDLVVPLSNILNRCANDETNDLAASLALDAVTLLCNSNTVNIVSTWNAVKNIFRSNRQHRTVQSLCEFFGAVPLLKVPSADYEAFFDESLQRLWHFVIDFDITPMIIAALKALKNFDFTDLMFKHVPAIFTENTKIPNEFQKLITASVNDPLRNGPPLTAADVVPYIPGECWIELLEKVNQNAIDASIELVTHLVDTEICQFRSGTYLLGERRAEPSELVQLHARSPLRALVKHAKHQSQSIDDPIVLTHCLRCLAQKYSRPLPPLNWFFLTEYINVDAHIAEYSTRCEMKKYALTIAANQMVHSGSAKNLIENYVQAFSVADSTDDETLMIFQLLPTICHGITSTILASFLSDALSFLFGLAKSSQFEVNCTFEQAIESIAKIFNAKCLIAENLDIVADELIKYEASLDADTRIHRRFCQFLIEVPAEVLERISTHSTWTLDHFKKSFALRTSLIAARRPHINSSTSLMWLNAIVDNCCIDNDIDEKQKLILRHLPSLIRNWTEPKEMCDWLLFCMSKTQAQLTDNNNSTQAIFALDLFLYSITIVAACDTFCPPLCTANRIHWLKQFPVALELLGKNSFWTDDIVRIYEFLYHLNTQQTDLPKEYLSIACQALICNKNHEYFLRKLLWMKFISLQK